MKKRGKLKLKKETLAALTRPNQVVGAYETEFFVCAGSLACPLPNCPSAPYQSCVPNPPVIINCETSTTNG